MSMSDPIADFLTRIRNAVFARKKYVDMPASNQKVGMAELMKQSNFIKDFNVIENEPQNILRIHLQYVKGAPSITGITKISKPGLRRYVGKDDIPRVLNGLGMAIISTSQGLLTDKQARQQEVGGEVVCHIW